MQVCLAWQCKLIQHSFIWQNFLGLQTHTHTHTRWGRTKYIFRSKPALLWCIFIFRQVAQIIGVALLVLLQEEHKGNSYSVKFMFNWIPKFEVKLNFSCDSISRNSPVSNASLWICQYPRIFPQNQIALNSSAMQITWNNLRKASKTIHQSDSCFQPKTWSLSMPSECKTGSSLSDLVVSVWLQGWHLVRGGGAVGCKNYN